MPLRKSPPKLEEICFKVVAENYDNLNISDIPYVFIRKLYDNRHLLSTINPLSTNIFMNRCTKKLESVYEFILPLNHKTPDYRDLCLNEVLSNIQTRCKNLTHLNLDNLCTISSERLSTLITHLPKLQLINLSKTKCNDNILEVIGNSCKDLRHVDVSHSFVSRAGIRQLSTTNKEIQVLNIEGIKVTSEDCLYVLEALENLKTFVTGEWKKIFSVLKERFESKQTLPIRNIQVIPSTSHEYAFMQRSVKWLHIFPKLSDLTVMFTNGNRLIDDICDSCPNLETFFLQGCDIGCAITRSEKKSTALFRRLRTLKVIKCTIASDELMSLILSAPNLQQLVLYGVHSFTDDLLSSVLDLNGLQQLRVLRMTTSFEISLVGMMRLLRRKSPLNELVITHCQSIDEEAFTALQTYVRVENLDVNIKSSTFSTEWNSIKNIRIKLID